MSQSSMINMIGFVLLLVALPVLGLTVYTVIYMSIDTHALAVPCTCKYFAVQVMTGLAHIMSAKSK